VSRLSGAGPSTAYRIMSVSLRGVPSAI
jgi:hypothetical protein